MDAMTPAVAWLLVLAVLGVVGFFAPRQMRELAAARLDAVAAPIDRRFRQWMAVRRLIGCGLLLVIAVLIAGSFLSGLDAHVSEDAPDRDAARLWAWTYILVLTALLGVVVLAGVDLWAIARYRARHLSTMKHDHRAKLLSELDQWRRRRDAGRET